MKKKISILGSTGSIGLSTLSIIDKKKKFFKVILLTSNKNYSLICNQIRKYKPKYFLINDQKIFDKVKKRFIKNKTKLINTLEIKNLNLKSDIVISAP